MSEIQFFYDEASLQIVAVFVDSKTGSAVFKDPDVYVEVNVVDPPYLVSRDHKVVLDDEDHVVDTEASPNPVQPAPAPDHRQTLLDSLEAYGVHSYTPAQVDAFIDSVSTVPELRALLKTMAKCIVAFAEYFES